MKMKSILTSRRGFSLAEVMIAMTLGTIMLASSYAVILSLAKGSESMMNFSEMNGQTRVALEMFGRDSRMADDVKIASSTKIRMGRELSGQPHEIIYEYIPTAGTFTRHVYLVNPATGLPELTSSRTLLFDVETLDMYYYTIRHDSTTNLLEVKHVQLEATLERKVLNLTNTNYIISARFMMRNKDVSN